ncbi:hypothetical protein ACEQ8H_008315 [Pleosporales sp. CAS-2024a]
MFSINLKNLWPWSAQEEKHKPLQITHPRLTEHVSGSECQASHSSLQSDDSNSTCSSKLAKLLKKTKSRLHFGCKKDANIHVPESSRAAPPHSACVSSDAQPAPRHPVPGEPETITVRQRLPVKIFDIMTGKFTTDPLFTLAAFQPWPTPAAHKSTGPASSPHDIPDFIRPRESHVPPILPSKHVAASLRLQDFNVSYADFSRMPRRKHVPFGTQSHHDQLEAHVGFKVPYLRDPRPNSWTSDCDFVIAGITWADERHVVVDGYDGHHSEDDSDQNSSCIASSAMLQSTAATSVMEEEEERREEDVLLKPLGQRVALRFRRLIHD